MAATPEELEALANRIDHEELWRQPGIDRDKMTPEQQDRLMAGVYLRRYARARGNMLEQLIPQVLKVDCEPEIRSSRPLTAAPSGSEHPTAWPAGTPDPGQ